MIHHGFLDASLGECLNRSAGSGVDNSARGGEEQHGQRTHTVEATAGVPSAACAFLQCKATATPF